MRGTSAGIRFGFAIAIVASAIAYFALAPASVAVDSAQSEQAAAQAAQAPSVDAGQPAKMQLTGTIQAVDKDLMGKATQVKIVSPEKGSFLIANSGKGEELSEKIGKTVTLTAHRTRDGKGNVVLSVDGYQVHES